MNNIRVPAGFGLRVARTSTAPPEGCTHIDEVLSAAPPDVEGSTLQAHFAAVLDGACPPPQDRGATTGQQQEAQRAISVAKHVSIFYFLLQYSVVVKQHKRGATKVVLGVI